MVKTKEKPASVRAETGKGSDVGSFTRSPTSYKKVYHDFIISQSKKKASIFCEFYRTFGEAVRNIG